MYAEQEEALKQQLRCTQEVLEAAREQEEEAAAEKAALEQVSYIMLHTYTYATCMCYTCVLMQLHACSRAAAAVRARRGRAVAC